MVIALWVGMWWLFAFLWAASILSDHVNYAIGVSIAWLGAAFSAIFFFAP